MYAVVQIGSRLRRSASGTNFRTFCCAKAGAETAKVAAATSEKVARASTPASGRDEDFRNMVSPQGCWNTDADRPELSGDSAEARDMPVSFFAEPAVQGLLDARHWCLLLARGFTVVRPAGQVQTACLRCDRRSRRLTGFRDLAR